MVLLDHYFNPNDNEANNNLNHPSFRVKEIEVSCLQSFLPRVVEFYKNQSSPQVFTKYVPMKWNEPYYLGHIRKYVPTLSMAWAYEDSCR